MVKCSCDDKMKGKKGKMKGKMKGNKGKMKGKMKDKKNSKKMPAFLKAKFKEKK